MCELGSLRVKTANAILTSSLNKGKKKKPPFREGCRHNNLKNMLGFFWCFLGFFFVCVFGFFLGIRF